MINGINSNRNLIPQATIHVDIDTGEILDPSKLGQYLKIKSQKHVQDFKITWEISYRKTRNQQYKQGSLF